MSDDSLDEDDMTVARVGSGKTATAIELLARLPDEGTMEWIDPKGANDPPDGCDTGEST